MDVMKQAQKFLAPGLFTVMLCAIASTGHAAPVSGAIFTTLHDGSAVDYNIYDAKEDVYLNGGPRAPKSPCTAAGLPDGVYYFQVTDPSGKYVLSFDPYFASDGTIKDDPEQRKVLVAGGYFVQYLGSTHKTDTGTKCDKPTVTIQLYPFHDTPNPGGEYKVWLAPALPGPNGTFIYGGFPASQSKTDNFKAPGDDESDSDGDGLTNGAEIGIGTNPFDADTDHDGFSDKEEVDQGTNPLDSSSYPVPPPDVS